MEQEELKTKPDLERRKQAKEQEALGKSSFPSAKKEGKFPGDEALGGGASLEQSAVETHARAATALLSRSPWLTLFKVTR